MKIKNIFKKTIKKTEKVSIEALDKKQLEKVIGGADDQKSKVIVRGWDISA